MRRSWPSLPTGSMIASSIGKLHFGQLYVVRSGSDGSGLCGWGMVHGSGILDNHRGRTQVLYDTRLKDG